jgi:hypothetical protein
MAINGQFVPVIADPVNKLVGWFISALMFQVLGFLKINGTRSENELALILAAKPENGKFQKTDPNVLLDTDDKYDLGFLILEDLTTQPPDKTAELLLSPTLTCDQAKETNLSKKLLKKSQLPSLNQTNSMPNSSVTNHNGLFVHHNNPHTEMF